MKKNLNVPNALSALRMLCAIPLWLLMSNNQMEWALYVYILALITDFLDGWIANHWHQHTDIGKLLDPWADKVLHVSVFLLFLDAYPELKVQMYIIIALAVVLIGLAGAKLYFSIKRPLGANIFGKCKMCAEGAAIAALYLGSSQYGGIFLWAAIGLAVCSILGHLMIRQPVWAR